MADKAFRVRNGLELGNDTVYDSMGTTALTTDPGNAVIAFGADYGLKLDSANSRGIHDTANNLVILAAQTGTSITTDLLTLQTSGSTAYFEYTGTGVNITSPSDTLNISSGANDLNITGNIIRLRDSNNVDTFRFNEDGDNYFQWLNGQKYQPASLISQNRGTTFTVKGPDGDATGESNYQRFAINNAGSGTTNVDLSQLENATGTWIITVKNNNASTCSVQTSNGVYSHNVSSGHSFVLIVFVLAGYIQHVINPSPAVLITPSNA